MYLPTTSDSSMAQNRDENQGDDDSGLHLRTGSGHEMELAPFWLRRSALLFFLAIFLACAASLIALDRVFTSRNGLPLSISSSSYSWTYGPTAILVVILSLWRRIDYYLKLREPWRELLAGPSPADKSILLDYITPFQVLAFGQALKRKHYSVAASIAAFFLLKLIILVSTTLFVVKRTDISATLDVTYQDAFNATDMWSNYHDLSSESSIYAGGLNRSIWSYLGKLNNLTSNDVGWRPPDGMVVSKFVLSSVETNATRLKAPVDILTSTISCEDATLSVQPAKSNGEDPTIHFTSATCSGVSGDITLCYANRYGLDPDTACENPSVYSVHRVGCPNSPEPRYAISTADFAATYEEDFTTKTTSLEIVRSAAIICSIGYQIATSTVVLDRMTGLVAVPDSTPERDSRLLTNLSNNALAEILWANLQSPAATLVVDQRVPTKKPLGPLNVYDPRAEDVLFQLMYAQLGRPNTLDPFYETSVLKNATISVLEGITLEFARQSLLVAQSSQNSVEGWVTKNRLHIRRLALWVIVGGFGLLALICLLLFGLARPFSWVPTISGSIAASAAILANSSELQTVLAGSGSIGAKQLKEKLSGAQFTARKANTGQLELHVGGNSTPYSEQEFLVNDQKKRYAWIPFTARLPVIATTYAAPLIVIGVLEVLYRVLREQRHLVLISSKDSATLSYFIRIASTLVIFGMATMINSLDFTIVTFAPYSNLRTGNVSADRSILFHLLSVNPFLVMFKSLRRRQFGPAASNAATIVAGILTIVVSGLWVPMESMLTNQPLTVVVNNWDRSWIANASDDGGAGVILNLIRYGGARSPTAIWEDIVLPENFLSIASARSDSGINYAFDTLVLQPVLNCSIIPQTAIENTYRTFQVSAGSMGQYAMASGTTITIQPPKIDEQCSRSPADGIGNLTFSIDFDTIKPLWVGQYLDLNQTTAGKIPADCPSVGIVFGSVTGNSTTDRNLTALVCSQGINHVPVTLDYSVNSTLLQITRMRVRGEPKSVRDITSLSRTFGYRLHDFMETSFLPFSANLTDTLYDSFFNHFFLRVDGHKREDLVGPENTEKFIQAVTQDYNEYLRLVINQKLRAGYGSSVDQFLSAVDDSSTQPSSHDSMTNGQYSAQVTHLVIDGTSKLVLQILLAAMTAFSLVGFMLVKIRGTLPRDPCSIGSTMAFLAESQLCDRGSRVIPQGAEYMGEKQLRKVFDGWLFSLGWWQISSPVAEERGLKDTQESRDSGKTIGGASPTVTMVMRDRKRFGVDVGKACA